MIKVSTKVDTRSLDKELRDMERFHGPAAASNVLNRVRTEVMRKAFEKTAKLKGVNYNQITSRHNAQGQRVGKRVWYTRSSRKKLFTGWNWVVKRRPGTIALIQVEPISQTGSGVKAGPVQVAGAFIATPRNQAGNKQVFKRAGRKRLPIVVQRLDLDPDATNLMNLEVRGAGTIYRKEAKVELDNMVKKQNARNRRR